MLGSLTRSQRRVFKWLFGVAFFAAFFALIGTFASEIAYAQIDAGADVAEQAGLATTDVRILIGNIVKGFLALLGFVSVAIIMYAGFLWMSAAGNADQIQKAQRIMANAAIGLFIIAGAYTITAFIFNALTGGQSGFGIGGRGTNFQGIFQGTAGTDALGSGIIEYHFPEPGQKDIARNTKISITFKQPLVLSTVFKGYDDNGTYDIADDVIPPVLELNTDNFRIIPEEQLGSAGNGSLDAQFANRYPENAILINPAPKTEITAVPAEFSALARQTIVITPSALLGSPTADITYRVGLRGGANGVRVWDVQGAVGAVTGTPVQEPAFGRATAEGGYRWSFTTNTKLDKDAPKISAVVPSAPANPTLASAIVPRNQLVQMYFNEAVDPTRLSGEITLTGGTVSVRVEARCRAGETECDPRYQGTDFATVPGSYVLGNKYRTLEFTPSTLCENVSENSCGDKVYCLPKNVDLRVRAVAATVGDDAPLSTGTTGVVDMVGNSLDGNGDGEAVGPVSATLVDMFSLNTPQTTLATVSDTAVALYALANTVDLTAPVVIGIDPRSVSSSGSPDVSTPYAEGGPSGFPPTKPIQVDWSKVISVTSLRTGKEDDPRATLVLDSHECVKNGNDVCEPGKPCTCTPADAPWFFPDLGAPVAVQGGGEGSELSIYHRPFFTANELGYTEGDIAAFPEGAPRYVPQLRAKIKDVRQNCFYPSVGFSCPADVMNGPDGPSSCCDREAQNDFSCPP